MYRLSGEYGNIFRRANVKITGQNLDIFAKKRYNEMYDFTMAVRRSD